MADITLPILKTILLSFGHDRVQTLPLNSSNPKKLHIVLKRTDVDCRKKKNKAGKTNELVLYNTIREYLNQYETLNLKFHTGSRMFLVSDVTDAIHVAHDTAGRRKADVNLLGAFSGAYSLSIKEPKFVAWEAVETYWKDKSNVLDYALATFPSKVDLHKTGNEYVLSPSISVKCNLNEAKDVIFGTDILGKGLVLSQSWKSGHFDWDERSKTLSLVCDDIIRSEERMVLQDC